MEIALAIRVLWMTAMVTSLAAIARCATTSSNESNLTPLPANEPTLPTGTQTKSTTDIIDETATLTSSESTIEAETSMLSTGKSTLTTETSTLPAGETTLPTEKNTSATDDHVDEEERRLLIIALLVLSAIFIVLLVGCLLCNRDDAFHVDEERPKRKRDVTVVYNETFKMVADDSGEIVEERAAANIQAPLYSTSKTVETGAGPLPATGRIQSMEESMFPTGQLDVDADVIINAGEIIEDDKM